MSSWFMDLQRLLQKKPPFFFLCFYNASRRGGKKIRLIRKPLLVANKWKHAVYYFILLYFQLWGGGGGFMTYLTWTIKMFKITVSCLIMTTIIDTETSDITLMGMLMMVIDLKTKIVKFMAEWSHIQVARFVSKYHIVKKW